MNLPINLPTVPSPCHNDWNMGATFDGKVLVGYCGTCDEAVIRINPNTGEAEWLDGSDPHTPELLRVV